jgi:hypothetical protein
VAKAKTPVQTPVKTPMPSLVEQEHGGALFRGGTGAGGRPKEVWRQRVRDALERAGGVEFLVKVVKGEVKEQVVNGDGNVVESPPKVRDRIVAANILIEQAYGKAPQEIKIEDEKPRRTGEELMARLTELLPHVIPLLPIDKQAIARLLAQRRQIEVLVQGKQVEDVANRNGDGASS